MTIPRGLKYGAISLGLTGAATLGLVEFFKLLDYSTKIKVEGNGYSYESKILDCHGQGPTNGLVDFDVQPGDRFDISGIKGNVTTEGRLQIIKERDDGHKLYIIDTPNGIILDKDNYGWHPVGEVFTPTLKPTEEGYRFTVAGRCK